MASNTEPIFIRNPFTKTVRLQSNVVALPTASNPLTTAELVAADAQGNGALLVDLWAQPLGAISTGFFLRCFLWDPEKENNLLFEVAIAASSGSPLVRQELGNFLPEILSPTQTGVAGKKRALYLAPGQRITISNSADLPSPIVVGCQGGDY